MSSKGVTVPHRIQDYIVLQTLGEGVFGKVFQCFNSKTSEVVALKVLKNQDPSDLEDEVENLRTVGQSDPSKHNIVKFIDVFSWDGYNCMAFEMLDCSLHDFVHKRNTRISLSEIRVITQQLLVAFDRLKKLEIVHTDLKLDNVMLVDQKKYPLRVRLIDFGLASHISELVLGTSVSPHCLKSPEVNLGLPLTEALDMWSLGCSLFALFFGPFPFSGSSPYDNQRSIVNLLGYPPDDLLNRGVYSRFYYSQEKDGQWRLKSPEEYLFTTGKDPKVTRTPFDDCDDLEDAILFSTSPADQTEMRDRIGFLDLVKKLLHLDYEKRITPSEALQHPFITLEYFDEDNGEYAQRAKDFKNMVFRNNSISSEEKPNNSNQDDKEMSPAQSQSSPVCAPRKCTFTQVDEGTQILKFHDSINSEDNSVKDNSVIDMGDFRGASKHDLSQRQSDFSTAEEKRDTTTLTGNPDNDVINTGDIDFGRVSDHNNLNQRQLDFSTAEEKTDTTTLTGKPDNDVINTGDIDFGRVSDHNDLNQRCLDFSTAEEKTDATTLTGNPDNDVINTVDIDFGRVSDHNALNERQLDFSTAEEKTDTTTLTCKPDNEVINTVDIDFGRVSDHNDLNERQLDFSTVEEKTDTTTLTCKPDNEVINTGDIDFESMTDHNDLNPRRLDFSTTEEKTDTLTLTGKPDNDVINTGDIDFGRVSDHNDLDQRQLDFSTAEEKTQMQTLTTNPGDVEINIAHVDFRNISNHKHNQRQTDSGDAIIDMPHVDFRNVCNHNNNQMQVDSGHVIVDMGDDQEEIEDTNSRGVT